MAVRKYKVVLADRTIYKNRKIDLGQPTVTSDARGNKSYTYTVYLPWHEDIKHEPWDFKKTISNLISPPGEYTALVNVINPQGFWVWVQHRL